MTSVHQLTPARDVRTSGTPAAGWAAVAATVIAVGVTAFAPLWMFPSTGASSGAVTRYMAEHRAATEAMMVGYTLAVSLWLIFGAGVFTRLRAIAPHTSMVPVTFALGLSGFVTLLLAGFAAFDVAVYRSASPSDTKLLYDVAFGLLAMSGMPTTLALTAYAGAVYRWGGFPRRSAHLAVLAAAAHTLLLLSFIVARGFFSLEGLDIVVVPVLLWIWIADTGVAMLRVDRQDAAVDT